MPISMVPSGQAENKSFVELTGKLARLVDAGEVDAVDELVADYLVHNHDKKEELFLAAAKDYVKGDFESVIAKMVQVGEMLKEGEYPPLGNLYSLIYVYAQLRLPRRLRPVQRQCHEYYRRNISALGDVDPVLAEQVQAARWEGDYIPVAYWGGVHLYSQNDKQVLVLSSEAGKFFAEQQSRREFLGFGGICSGQELRYCLEHHYTGLHGMLRGHYLFEPEVSRVKLLLHLFDMAEELLSHEVIIFSGSGMAGRIEEIFGSWRYPIPSITVGNTEMVQELLAGVQKKLISTNVQDTARQYYASGEFRGRLEQISRGELKPRVMVITCRWTTFLKYCAADFEKAFIDLGCPTRFLMEENDVQALLPVYCWHELADFRPDVVFMVSHARPSNAYFPRELPFIGYIQDKCGPIVQLPELSEHITDRDLFVCMFSEFRRYLLGKGVPEGQAFVMPIPADEKMFFPLPADHPQAERFTVDVGFVKHGDAASEVLFERFMQQYIHSIEDEKARQALQRIFTRLYDEACRDVSRCYYEPQMQEFAGAHLSNNASADGRHFLHQLVNSFYITVYSSAWRCQFLEALDRAGIELALYGGGWTEHARLKHLARGPVERDGGLNCVYNFSRINLSINHSASMHQRLSECGLAGGFMMAADHGKEDWESARPYFEADREIIYFTDCKELVDKCRYYLAHEDERREIARRMHERALRERTCRVGAETILTHWRELLGNSMNKKSEL